MDHDETMFDFLDDITRKPWLTGLPFIDFVVRGIYYARRLLLLLF
jgi:hypothetical protein